uniref:Ice-structuring protein 4-like n=1 Tax=Parastrongyloides trichosuri TaxID=131310 RepID=A0A0N4ZS87_PARTI
MISNNSDAKDFETLSTLGKETGALNATSPTSKSPNESLPTSNNPININNQSPLNDKNVKNDKSLKEESIADKCKSTNQIINENIIAPAYSVASNLASNSSIVVESAKKQCISAAQVASTTINENVINPVYVAATKVASNTAIIAEQGKNCCIDAVNVASSTLNETIIPKARNAAANVASNTEYVAESAKEKVYNAMNTMSDAVSNVKISSTVSNCKEQMTSVANCTMEQASRAFSAASDMLMPASKETSKKQ